MLVHPRFTTRPRAAAHSPRGRRGVPPLAEEGLVAAGESSAVRQLAEAMKTCWIVAYGAMVLRQWPPAGLVSRKTACGGGRQSRFLRPLDQDLDPGRWPLASAGGDHGRRRPACRFRAAVVEAPSNDNEVWWPVLRIGIPDQLVDHGQPDQSKQALGAHPRPAWRSASARVFGPCLSSAQPLSVGPAEQNPVARCGVGCGLRRWRAGQGSRPDSSWMCCLSDRLPDLRRAASSSARLASGPIEQFGPAQLNWWQFAWNGWQLPMAPPRPVALAADGPLGRSRFRCASPVVGAECVAGAGRCAWESRPWPRAGSGADGHQAASGRWFAA